jgi:hypothetical protein
MTWHKSDGLWFFRERRYHFREKKEREKEEERTTRERRRKNDEERKKKLENRETVQVFHLLPSSFIIRNDFVKTICVYC